MSDVEPRAPGAPDDPRRQGGLKDRTARPQPKDDAAEADIETGEEADEADSGGMIGEG